MRSDIRRLQISMRCVPTLALIGVLSAPPPVGAQQPEDSPLIQWRGGPSLRLGDAVRVDFRARLQADLAVTDDVPTSDEPFSWGNRRIGVEGTLFKRVEFQIERELQDEKPWRDVFADLRLHRGLRIRAGHFKVPFSMERTTSAYDLDFVMRATPVADLALGREVGVMVHGDVVKRLIEYETGMFAYRPDADDALDGSPADPWKTVAGRITVKPVRNEDDSLTHDLHFGIGVAQSTLPEGLHATVGHFVSGEAFSEWFFVNGTRTRIGVEGLWNVGRLSFKGEFIRLADSRRGQSVIGTDLSDLTARGGYVSGLWRVAGQIGKSGHALDLAARFDSLSIGSRGQTDGILPNPRVDFVPSLRKDTWTVGGNWLMGRWVKVQLNGVRETLVDPLDARRLVAGARWSGLLRLQLAI